MTGLLIVILPLTLGYFFRVSSRFYQRIPGINGKLLYLLLFMMGVSLAQVDNLYTELPKVGLTVTSWVVVVCLLNAVFAWGYDLKSGVRAVVLPEKFGQGVTAGVGVESRAVGSNVAEAASSAASSASYSASLSTSRASKSKSAFSWKPLIEVGLVLAALGVGFVCGTIALQLGGWKVSAYILTIIVVMIFLVGVQLRNGGYKIKQILLNRHGLYIAALTILSSAVASLICWFFFPELKLVQALMLGFGMAWYSLTSVVVSQHWGTLLGSTMFFIDLGREVVALILVPLIAARFPSVAISVPGSTSFNATLPLIQKSGGMGLVPVALSSGFYLCIFTPLMLVVLPALGDLIG